MPPTIREQSEQLKVAAAEHHADVLGAERYAEVLEMFEQNIQDFIDQGIPTESIKAGDLLDQFTLDDATGAPVSLDQILDGGPAVIVFYRGGWCPFCNLALRTYQQELLPQLDAFGAQLVAISPQSPDESLSTVEKAALEFTVLSDPASRLADRIGIAFDETDDILAAQRQLGLDVTKINAEGAVRLPRPTVLIVDKDRTIRFVDVQPDFTVRTEVADIIAALTDLT